MKIEDFCIYCKTEKNFNEAVVSVLRAVEQKGYFVSKLGN